MILIDLSVPLNERTPAYPGDPRTAIKPGGVLGKDGYEDHYVCAGTHVGTHVDAPAHMISGGKTIDQIPIERMSGKGAYVKLENGFDLETIARAPIENGSIVLFDTGMGRAYHESAYYEKYPAMPEAVAEYLVHKGVKMIGVDACSPDYEPFPSHRILLRNGVLIIENLSPNIALLEGKQFKVYAFPIKLELDGAPARVIAEILS